MSRTSSGFEINVVVLYPKVLKAFGADDLPTQGFLKTRTVDDVLYVLEMDEGAGDTVYSVLAEPTSDGPRDGIGFLKKGKEITAYIDGSSVTTMPINLDTDLFQRQKGIFETRMLKDKTVAVIGLGSGGSLAAVELAKTGVGRFKLVDFDRLEVHNISRHMCGVGDVGRMKTAAVRDQVLEKNPEAVVETFDMDITKEVSVLEEVLNGSDLVLACTDTERSKLLINSKALEIGVPVIYAGVYERAFGGDVLRVVPGQTPCYDCVIGSVKKNLEEMPRQAVIDYSNIDDPADFKAEPGLGIDIDFITLFQVKIALLTLLRGEETGLEDIDSHFMMWSNRKEWIFKEPFQRIFAEVAVRQDCMSCQQIKVIEEKLTMTEEEIKQHAEDILTQTEDRTGGGGEK